MKKAIITAFLLSPFVLFAQITIVGSETITYNKVEIPDPALIENVTEFDNQFITGVSYYNRAVLLLEKSLEGKKEVEVEEVIEPVTEIFKMSEKHLLNAHQLNPKDKITIGLLSSIYFALNNQDKCNSFQGKTEK